MSTIFPSAWSIAFMPRYRLGYLGQQDIIFSLSRNFLSVLVEIDHFSTVTLILFLLSTVFVIQPVKIPIRLPYLGRRRIPINPNTAPILAIAILWASGCLGPKQIHDGIIGTDGIKPYNILILFISLAYLAITLDITGVLQAAAFWVSNRGGSNGRKLYLYFYIMFTLTSMILGNDPIILSGTVFLVYYTAAAQLQPLPWLVSEFAAANTASMVLFVGNPTNAIICEGFGINKAAFTAYTILPFVACSISCFATLALQFRGAKYVPRKLNITGQLNAREVLRDPVGAIVGIIVLGGCLMAVLTLSFLHIDIWKIALPFAGFKLCFDMIWDHYRFVTGRLSEAADRAAEEDAVKRALQRATTASEFPHDQDRDRESTLVAGHGQASTDKESPRDPETNSNVQSRSSPLLHPEPIFETRSTSSDSNPLAFFRAKYRSLAFHFPTPLTALPRLPLGLVSFLFSQFILIEALTLHGWTQAFGKWLAIASGGKVLPTVWLVGILDVILCNIAGTSLGAAILLTRIVHLAGFDGPTERSAAISLAVASNIGAVSFTPSASLAGLLWDSILRQKGIVVRRWEFTKWNMLPLIFMTGVGLGIVSAEVAVLYQRNH